MPVEELALPRRDIETLGYCLRAAAFVTPASHRAIALRLIASHHAVENDLRNTRLALDLLLSELRALVDEGDANALLEDLRSLIEAVS